MSRNTPSMSTAKSRESAVSTVDSYDGNEILKLLRNCEKSKGATEIEFMKKNIFCLKTALMMPIQEFVELYPKYSIQMSTYLKYSVYEELYGLLLVIRKKNMPIFRFLWNDCGVLWGEDHFLPVLDELIDVCWCKGILQLFASERAQDIFYSLSYEDKRALYSKFQDICRDLDNNEDQISRKILKCIIRGLSFQPYAMFTLMFLFPYVYKTVTPIDEVHIQPHMFDDDLFKLSQDTELVHKLAVQFHNVCNGNLANKMAYHPALLKILDSPALPILLPSRKIWKSISSEDDQEFRTI